MANRKYTFIVTGATSMLGVAFIHEAIAHGDKVIAIVRPNGNNIFRLPKSDLIHILPCDLSGLASINSLPDADVFYHFGWIGTEKSSRDDSFSQVDNIRYSLDAVQLAKQCGCSKFVGCGSQAEYGTVSSTSSENMRVMPKTSYGVAKLAADLLCAKACDQLGLKFAWARVFSAYGVYDHSESLVSYALNAFLSGRTAEFSAATQTWNYLFDKDAGKIFYRLGLSNASGIYNVANDKSMPLSFYIKEMARICETFSGLQANYSFRKEDTENLFSLNPSVQKLEDCVGTLSFTDFSIGVSEVVKAIMGGYY